MFFDVRLVAVSIIMIIQIQLVQSQNNVTLSIESAKPYQCSRILQLKCTYTGTDPCCTQDRTWKAHKSTIMRNGVSTGVENKYKEGKISSSGKYFILLINTLEKADLENSYSCEYDFDVMLDEKIIGGNCVCLDCSIRLLGYEAAGTVLWLIVLVIGISVLYILCCGDFRTFLKDRKKKLAGALAFNFIVSFFANNVIAGPLGFYENISHEWIMAVGAVNGLLGSAVASYFYYIEIFDRADCVPLLVLTVVEAIAIGVVDFVLVSELFKGQCDRCGGRSYLWAVAAIVLTMIIIWMFLWWFKKLNKQTFIFGFLIVVRNLVMVVVFAVPLGIFLCPCDDWTDPSFAIYGVIYSLVLLRVFWKLIDTDEDRLLIALLTFGGTVIIIPLFVLLIYKGNRIIKVHVGEKKTLPCPCTTNIDKEKIAWFKNEKEVAKGTEKLSESKFRINEKGDLCITNVQKEDAGIYECASSGKVGTGSRLKLCVTSGNNRSTESGSSCWPICRVGQDPNTPSPDPEKVRSSPSKKQRPEKKKNEKPTEVVRPLPPKAQHLKTDNKESTTYSAENETFSDSLDKSSKQRPLPSITSKSPRPLPQRPLGDQQEKGGIKLEPLQAVGDSSPEKKKKKKRKKETKQSDKENSTDF